MSQNKVLTQQQINEQVKKTLVTILEWLDNADLNSYEELKNVVINSIELGVPVITKLEENV